MSMSIDSNLISRMRAITISREYGSGGGEIALRLASCLNWGLVDHEIVVKVATELGISEAEAEAHDEYSQGIVGSILTRMRIISPTPLVGPMLSKIGTDPRLYHEVINGIITGAAAVGHAIVVGRGGQVLFANRRDVLHVRVVAPFQQRVAYVMQREGLDQKTARSRVQLKENDRQRYLQAQYRHNPEDVHLYDLVVNTGVLSLNNAVDLIAKALEYKAERLATPTEDLGPGAGLQPYPSQPGDIRPPESMPNTAK